MAALLFLQPLFQRFHQLLEPAQGLDLRLFLVAQMAFGQLAQPVLGQVDGVEHLFGGDRFKALKRLGKGPVEAVEVAFVLHHRGAGEIIEPVHVIGAQTGGQPFKKAQIFAQGNRNPAASECVEKGQEHRGRLRSCGR